jgi:PEP-CTERM motif-containing protein
MKGICRLVAIVWVGIWVGAVTASAANFSGNPVADGWQSDGISTNLGTYVRGDAGLVFGVYSTEFTITAGSPLISGGWQVGDEVLGLGGTNESGFVLAPRIIAKFGATGADFTASTALSPSGNGNGSFPTNSGIGGVEVAFWYQYTGGNSGNTLASSSDNGGIRYPNTATNAQDLVLYNLDDVSLTNYNLNAYGAVVSQFQRIGGKDVLESWEAVVDITALSDPSRGDFGSNAPSAGLVDDATLQKTVAGSPADYTDALVSVPEPSTYSLLLISMASCGWFVGRRRHASR